MKGRVSQPHEELIIDLFAGGGGASTGILMATGRHPDLAVNHNAEAVDLHKANHPETLHLCEDIRKVDPVAVLKANWPGRRVGLLWASPDCRHHSKASGGALKDRGIRGLAWEVIRWAAAIKRATGAYPRMIALENVEEFQEWGPVHRYGSKAGRAMKKRRAETFRLWCEQWAGLGGKVFYKELTAADHETPTTRKRLFVVISFDGEIRWPEPTHGKVARQGTLFDAALEPWLSAADHVIDWSQPCPSIFKRKKKLAPKTHKRIFKGIKRYVIEAPKPFIVPITHTGERRVPSVSEPLNTVTSAHRGEFSLCAPHITKFHAESGGQGIELPPPTVTANSFHKRPGCGIPLGLSGAFLAPRYGERPGQEPRTTSIEAPAPTVVPSGNGGSLVEVRLGGASVGVGGRAGQSPPRGLDQPVNTVTAKADRAIASAALIRTDMQSSAPRTGVHHVGEPVRTITSGGGFGHVAAYLGRQFGTTTGADLRRPHPTVMTDGGGGKSQIVTAHLGRQFGKSVGAPAFGPVPTITAGGGGKTQLISGLLVGTSYGDDRPGAGLRAWPVQAPLRTVTGSGAGGFQIAAPILDKYYETGVAQRADRPLDTVTAKGRFGLNAAFLEQANTGVIGHSAEEPVSTVTAAGSQQRLIKAKLAEMGAEPGSTRLAVLEFLWEHAGAPTEAEWADPMGTAASRLKFGLVILDGVCWQIVDIGMRMLTPRELFNAQGFPPDYEIEITWSGKRLTKTAQTRMAGNSVCPKLARDLLKAILPPQMVLAEAA